MSILFIIGFVLMAGGFISSMFLYLHYQGRAALVALVIGLIGLGVFIYTSNNMLVDNGYHGCSRTQ